MNQLLHLVSSVLGKPNANPLTLSKQNRSLNLRTGTSNSSGGRVEKHKTRKNKDTVEIGVVGKIFEIKLKAQEGGAQRKSVFCSKKKSEYL